MGEEKTTGQLMAQDGLYADLSTLQESAFGPTEPLTAAPT